MKKYQKVYREMYEQWYRENQAYREQVAADENRLAYHLMPETGWLNDPNGPVSYTHLDVYKRQVYNLGRRSLGGEGVIMAD